MARPEEPMEMNAEAYTRMTAILSDKDKRIAELEAKIAGLKKFEAKQAAMVRALQRRLSRAGLNTSIPDADEREQATK